MRVIRSIDDLTPDRPTAVTIGAFDGVHLGHIFLFDQLKEHARELGARTLAVTFDPDPSEIISPHPSPHLTSLEEKLELIEQVGLDEVCVVHFDRALAQLTAQEFMDNLRAHASIVELLVGHDFAMGHDRQGTRSVLEAYCQQHGIRFFASEPLKLDGRPVSATRIRKLLSEGDIHDAGRLLGRHPFVSGRVVEGDKRGRSIGFPTANVGLDPRRALPADGVYVAYSHVRGQRRQSVVNIGLRPTFDTHQRTVESYVLDFEGDLYGEKISVEFLHRLRGEQKFPGITAIREQIARDVEAAHQYFAELPASQRV